MNASVVIVQNNFGRCGRTQVMARVITLLNSLGIRPLVVANRFAASHMVEDLNFDLQIVPPMTRGAFPAVDIALLNRAAARQQPSVLVNSNNTDLFLPLNKTISYVHFPLWSRLKNPSKLLSYNQVWRITFERAFFLFMQRLFLRAQAPRATFFNSRFTRSSAETGGIVSYPVPDLHTRKPLIKNERNLKKVCYLARFEKTKRQDEMIRLAVEMPDYTFVLCGFSSSDRYLRYLQNLIKEIGANNVQLVVNASQETVVEILSTSGFYVHLKVLEPFGIGIVEALDKGCLPIVHDSGGAVEIVNNPDLRFRELSEIYSILSKERAKWAADLTALTENLTRMRHESSLNLFLDSLERMLLTSDGRSAKSKVQ